MADDRDLTFLGQRLKELRKTKHNYSMDDMVKKLAEIDYTIGNKSTLSRVESGSVGEKTAIEIARKYCEVFGMSESQTEQFLRGVRIAIPDTSALLKNTHLIDDLNHEYSKVIIPRVVVDELDYIKNHNNNTTLAKKAWEILRGIGYGDKIILKEYTGDQNGVNNDCKIIDIARKASEEYFAEVDIITEDTDYSVYLKGDRNVSAVHLKDYMKKKQTLLNMERLDYFNSLVLDSYDDIEKPTPEEANGYLRDGNTLIISTIRNNTISFQSQKKKIKWLISCGADINKRDMSRRYFPALTHAVQKNDLDMLLFLLNECGANPNVGSRNPQDSGYVRQKNEGNMPLMVAAWHGRDNLVRALCENEKTSINQQDANGYTALMKACMNGNIRCRDILQEFHADEKIVDINGMTAMDHYNAYLENGPAEKRYNRGGNNKKSYNIPYNNNRRRW